MRKGTGIAFVLLATLAVCQPTEAKRKSKKNKNAIAALVKDSVNADYKKVTKERRCTERLVHHLIQCQRRKTLLRNPGLRFRAHLYPGQPCSGYEQHARFRSRTDCHTAFIDSLQQGRTKRVHTPNTKQRHRSGDRPYRVGFRQELL